MKKYKIDLKHQIQSFKVGFKLLVWLLLTGLIVYFIENETDVVSLLVVFILFWLVTSVVSTLPLYLNYLKINWKTVLYIDNQTKHIEIIQSGNSFKYQFSDIHVTQHLLGHFRPDRSKSWFPIPFNYYGYLEIESKDHKIFYATSLMIDPFKPPIPIDKTKYRFPFIRNW